MPMLGYGLLRALEGRGKKEEDPSEALGVIAICLGAIYCLLIKSFF